MLITKVRKSCSRSTAIVHTVAMEINFVNGSLGDDGAVDDLVGEEVEPEIDPGSDRRRVGGFHDEEPRPALWQTVWKVWKVGRVGEAGRLRHALAKTWACGRAPGGIEVSRIYTEYVCQV